MDLFCPHCTKRVTIPDDKAGQATSCPLCAKQFKAPMLTTPPAPKPPAPPAPPPPSPMSTFSVAPPPPAPPPVLSAPPGPVQSTIIYPPKDPAKGESEGSDGQYTRSLQLTLSSKWLAFAPTLCVGMIFVLSFFPWHHHLNTAGQGGIAVKKTQEAPGTSAALWTLAYSDAGIKPQFLAYVLVLVFLMLATPSLAVMDLTRGSGPAKTDGLVKWAHLGVAFVFAVGFFLLLVSWFLVHFVTKNDSLGFGLEMALCLQLIGTLGCLGLFWLAKRKPENLPPPRMKVRW